MHFNNLAKAALVSGMALEAAAGPVQMHAVREISSASASKNERAVHANVHVPTYTKTDVKFGGHTVPKRTVPTTHTLHERQPAPLAARWQRTKRVPADATLPMRIGLKARNLDEGHKRLMDIADPKSANFAKHMSSKEVVDFFAPERATVDAVVAWVTSSGIDIERVSLSANKQWIQFDASTAEAEQLLLTEYHEYEHNQHGTRDIATEHYHVPRAVQPHIDYITPGIRLRHDDGAANKAAKSKKRSLEKKAQRAAAAPKAPKDRRSFRAQYTDPTHVDTDGAALGTQAPPAFNSSTCYKYVTPDCVRAQYGIPKGTTATKGNELGIFESLGQHYSKDDLDTYFKAVAPEVQGTYPENRLIDGATADTTVALAGSEAELDFQAVMPLIYPQSSVLFQVDDERIQVNMTMAGTPYMGFWNTFFDAIDGSYCTSSAYGETGNCVKPECLDPSYPDNLPGGYSGSLQCGVYEPTNVISISYGSGEEDLPGYYWKRQCDEMLKLGLQGVTVVISSGDYGVGQWAGEGGNADGCAGSQGQIFYPSSQATCPYALAVGSTELYQAPAVTKRSNCSATAPKAPKLKERATSRFGSGGGFSNYFDQPSYQSTAVNKYLSEATLPFTGYTDMGNRNFSGVGTGVYRSTGRGYPDVSAVGDYFLTVLNGEWSLIGGTSLSAPLWASVLTLINEQRLALGKQTVGFVNPTLYEHPEVFNDVLAGSNPGCMTNGFPAAKGWDPVTGLGSPNFPKLIELFKSLQ
ncbi:alkaline serine protease [Ophiostoma piceae UAMH 11346]|uniref:tripeptidyl-peptidase II n=1 Tax=Ophiostoma piceae (strain UAMH 11346) TaxID=1262450 RepID=S3D046_OPHP1|nr:alkaline serine protease [Ophiostoma piceae UAMH 11346]